MVFPRPLTLSHLSPFTSCRDYITFTTGLLFVVDYNNSNNDNNDENSNNNSNDNNNDNDSNYENNYDNGINNDNYYY